MFRVTTEARQYIKQLEKVKGDLGVAAARAINDVAGMAHAASIRRLRSEFTIRNKYTEGSLRFYKASEERAKLKLDGINAISGTVSEYLPGQDSGLKKRPRPGSKYIPMPTIPGRGGKYSSPVPKRFRMKELGEFSRGGRVKKGSGFFVLPSGIYYRKGKPKKGRRAAGHARPLRPLVMIRTLGTTTQVIKKTGWHTTTMRDFGTYANMNRAFINEAKAILAARGLG